MLTAVARDVRPYLAMRPPAGVRVDRDDETLMATTLVDLPTARLDADLTTTWDLQEHRISCTVESGDRVAAAGAVGVLRSTATFDAIETTPAFQRRGLGRHVMACLTTEAMGRGATRGVLAASAAGRALYTTLGWDVRLKMVSFMGA